MNSIHYSRQNYKSFDSKRFKPKYTLYYSVFARDVTDLSSAMLEVQRTNMAAAHAEQPSRNALEKGIIHEIPLSNYATSLDSIVKKR